MFTSFRSNHNNTKKLRNVLSKRILSNINDLLEPLFQNGKLTNYRSDGDKRLIKSLVKQHDALTIPKIKKWIDIKNNASKKYESTDSQQYTMKPPSEITTLKLERWKHYLKNCHLPDAQWVLDSIRNGFSLNTSPKHLQSAKKNLISATQQPELIDEYLANELKLGQVAGPFDTPPYKDFHVNRFGVVPKSNGKWRMITDLSFPHGFSVNDGVLRENYNVKYVGLTAAIEKILHHGEGCVMAKFDLQRAYRLLAVTLQDRQLLVTKWKNQYYVDLCLPFGARSAPQIFTRFADILEWIFIQHGPINNIQHSLDDFFVCGPPQSDYCQKSLDVAFSICEDLGVGIEHSKTDGPSTNIVFLGLILDTDNMQISIPEAKLIKIQLLIEQWITKQSGSKRSLLSLVGSLFYCSQVVINGRLFLKNLVQRAYSVDRLYDTVKLQQSDIDDLSWWCYLLMSWNGRSMLSDLHGKNVVKLHS